MGTLPPRIVVVRRRSDYEQLLAAHATRGAAEFFLRTRGQPLDAIEERHERLEQARVRTLGAVQARWRRTEVLREELSRFLFEPEDVVACVGQDGLVANVAKYLSGQTVIGLNPDREEYEGVLAPHAPEDAGMLLRAAVDGSGELELRTMVECRLDDGSRIVALNEIFVGHRSHQSARYRIRAEGREERQSSSGVVVVTGTGATGWGRSIQLAHRSSLALPDATEPSLAFFVREAWPSVRTGASVVEGRVEPGSPLELVSELESGGVCFGDGIEADRLDFGYGRLARIAPASERLALLRAA
jgi:NAD kinase